MPREPLHDDLTDDALTARVRVLQRRRGHRYSLDDVLTAWVALRARPEARRCLDLGCGIGSVLLMVADTLASAEVTGIEAQEVSFSLAERNVARNGLGARVSVHHGDLRDEQLLARIAASTGGGGGAFGFDLVTGTPPYKPVGTATPSPDAQRAHARVELRGGVEEYLLAAARVLAPSGVCVVCAEAGAEPRIEAGAARARLVPRERLDVIPRLGHKGRLFSVHTLVRGQDVQASEPVVVRSFVARDEQGARTPAERALRAFFGLAKADPQAADEDRGAAAC